MPSNDVEAPVAFALFLSEPAEDGATRIRPMTQEEYDQFRGEMMADGQAALVQRLKDMVEEHCVCDEEYCNVSWDLEDLLEEYKA